MIETKTVADINTIIHNLPATQQNIRNKEQFVRNRNCVKELVEGLRTSTML